MILHGMVMPMPSFDPEQLVEGYTITYGEVHKNGGNCWLGMPAVFIERVTTGTRYPETSEEYMEHGAKVPVTERRLADIVIGCEMYQRLVDAGVAVSACVSCPLVTKIGA
jgi:hypothetical protein